MFKSIESESIAEIIEKKSKFIATLYEANSKEEAEKILQDTRKKYYDAKHHCYAYIVEETKFESNPDENKVSRQEKNDNIENTIQKIEKCSDDGEPSGTAGAPLLSLLKSANLTNVIIIVTRYFGGILLGTGGLVRAYTEVAQKAIGNAKMVFKDYGVQYEIEISYNNLKELQFMCKKLKIKIVNIEYQENITLILESTFDAKKELEKSDKILKQREIKQLFVTIHS